MINKLITEKEIKSIERMPLLREGKDPRLETYVAVINQKMGVPDALKDGEVLGWKIANGVPSVGEITSHLASRGVARFGKSRPDQETISIKTLADRFPGWERACGHTPHVKHC